MLFKSTGLWSSSSKKNVDKTDLFILLKSLNLGFLYILWPGDLWRAKLLKKGPLTPFTLPP